MTQSLLSELEAVFGPESTGETPEERASSSKRLFVRSQHQISQHEPGAPGRVLNAQEALRVFGWNILKGLSEKAAVPILRNAQEPYSTIEMRFRDLKLPTEGGFNRAKWDKNTVEAFKNRKQIPFRKLERLAQVLSLDEELLGRQEGAGGDKKLGVRLRELRGGDTNQFTPPIVFGLTEAAWVIKKQYDLMELVQAKPLNAHKKIGFKPEPYYGNPNNPAWRIGFNLAKKTRELLKLTADEPIESLKELIEGVLGIPVVQLELPPKFAGATIANSGRRGIVVNLNGLNQNVWVRRMTLAHELGHLLWDPDQRLNNLIVDSYETLERDNSRDFVEMRANGFAINFLAPQSAALNDFEERGQNSNALQYVMSKYGISKTAAVYHLKNAMGQYGRDANLSELHVDLEPSDDWVGREELAVDYFKPQTVPISRRGRFASFVADAMKEKKVSEDTAAALLSIESNEVETAISFIRNIVSDEARSITAHVT